MSANSFGKVGRTMVACALGRGIGSFAVGLACANVSGAKDSGLCCSERCVYGSCVKKPFANERFGYFGAPK